MSSPELASRLLGLMPDGEAAALIGNANRDTRRHVMKLLTGEELAYTKCGIQAIRSLLLERYNPQGNCIAARNKNLIAIWQKLSGE